MAGNMESQHKALLWESLHEMPNLDLLNGRGRWSAFPRVKHRPYIRHSKIPLSSHFKSRGLPLIGLIFILLLLTGLVFAQTATVDVTLQADSQPVHNALGTLQNTWTGETFTAITDTNGLAVFRDITLAIDESPGVSRSFQLYQNFPNPCNGRTTVEYDVPKITDLSIIVYNLVGQKVKDLVDDEVGAGRHSAMWDGYNDAGRKVSSGVYIYRMSFDNISSSKKMLWLDGGSASGGYVNMSRTPLAKTVSINGVEYELSFVNTDSTCPKIEDYSQFLNVIDDTTFTVVASLFDDVAPCVVSDLDVSTSNVGAVALQWTAPGDDGGVGKASSYVVRINSVPVDSSNWDSSVDVNNEPVPLSAGSMQTMKIYSDIADTIYAALKSIDDKGNVSSVSNSFGAETGFYLLSGFLKQVPNMFGVDSAVVSFGNSSVFSDSGCFELKLRSAGENTFSVRKDGYYNYDKNMNITGNTNTDVTQMIEQYTDPVTGEDLLEFSRFLFIFDQTIGAKLFRWNDSDMPIKTWLNRTYLDTTDAYDVFEGGGAAYADSVWKGFESWEDAVNRVAGEMKLDSVDIFTEVDYIEDVPSFAGIFMAYDYGPSAATSSLIETYDNATPKKGVVKISGPPDYEPLASNIVTRFVSHETGHQLRFMEHSTYSNHIMNPSTFGDGGKPSDFEARMFIIFQSLENYTRIDYYTFPSKSTSMTNVPVFD